MTLKLTSPVNGPIRRLARTRGLIVPRLWRSSQNWYRLLLEPLLNDRWGRSWFRGLVSIRGSLLTHWVTVRVGGWRRTLAFNRRGNRRTYSLEKLRRTPAWYWGVNSFIRLKQRVIRVWRGFVTVLFFGLKKRLPTLIVQSQLVRNFIRVIVSTRKSPMERVTVRRRTSFASVRVFLIVTLTFVGDKF